MDEQLHQQHQTNGGPQALSLSAVKAQRLQKLMNSSGSLSSPDSSCSSLSSSMDNESHLLDSGMDSMEEGQEPATGEDLAKIIADADKSSHHDSTHQHYSLLFELLKKREFEESQSSGAGSQTATTAPAASAATKRATAVPPGDLTHDSSASKASRARSQSLLSVSQQSSFSIPAVTQEEDYLSLEYILRNSNSRAAFHRFLQEQKNDEMIEFLDAEHEFLEIDWRDEKNRYTKALDIIKRFIQPHGSRALNISDDLRKTILAEWGKLEELFEQRGIANPAHAQRMKTPISASSAATTAGVGLEFGLSHQTPLHKHGRSGSIQKLGSFLGKLSHSPSSPNSSTSSQVIIPQSFFASIRNEIEFQLNQECLQSFLVSDMFERFLESQRMLVEDQARQLGFVSDPSSVPATPPSPSQDNRQQSKLRRLIAAIHRATELAQQAAQQQAEAEVAAASTAAAAATSTASTSQQDNASVSSEADGSAQDNASSQNPEDLPAKSRQSAFRAFLGHLQNIMGAATKGHGSLTSSAANGDQNESVRVRISIGNERRSGVRLYSNSFRRDSTAGLSDEDMAAEFPSLFQDDEWDEAMMKKHMEMSMEEYMKTYIEGLTENSGEKLVSDQLVDESTKKRFSNTPRRRHSRPEKQLQTDISEAVQSQPVSPESLEQQPDLLNTSETPPSLPPEAAPPEHEAAGDEEVVDQQQTEEANPASATSSSGSAAQKTSRAFVTKMINTLMNRKSQAIAQGAVEQLAREAAAAAAAVEQRSSHDQLDTPSLFVIPKRMLTFKCKSRITMELKIFLCPMLDCTLEKLQQRVREEFHLPANQSIDLLMLLPDTWKTSKTGPVRAGNMYKLLKSNKDVFQMINECGNSPLIKIEVQNASIAQS